MLFFRKASAKDDKVAGEELFTKGQWAPALDAFERVLAKEPENAKILRRVADLRARVGKRSEAVEAYRKVAEQFAGSGFLVQAIAIQKILLRLDPSARDVGDKLADLYARRGLSPSAAPEGRKGLPSIPLFSDLDPESFRQLLDRLVPRSLSGGEALFRQGDPGDSIFIVASGSVRVARGEKTLAELNEGEFFGEAAFFSREPRNADVVAAGAAEVLEIRRGDLEALMAKYPGVGEALGTFYRRRVLDGVLAASSLFGALPEAERKNLADRFLVLRVAAGESVVREGERDRALFLIKQGRVRVSTTPPGGQGHVELAELGPGDFFGEVSVLSTAPRTATVTAVEAGEVLKLEGGDVDPLLKAYPELRGSLESARDRRATQTIARVLGRAS